ncbi:right-handed parallel beta-helix repeat-containing protein [Lachnoclostridium sp.]|uniref:right-handed parallel beta-helix repeat-containing protein n=1 Tax=Lachnoclostridium sp. TaxID=2028282 RepID=UPI0026C2BCCE|nr:right-handed parallel beta-helix repeat-containing protein [Lachnoclostridium sp.]
MKLGKISKRVAFVVTLAMMFGLFLPMMKSVETLAATTTTHELNVSNSMTVGQYSSDFTVNGFTFITGGSIWEVDNSNKSYGGVSYTNRVKSGGKGTISKRAISFTASGAGQLTVYAMSSGSTSRNVTLYGNGKDLESYTAVADNITAMTFTIPNSGTYVIYPPDDGISYYYFKVVKTDSTQTPTPTPTVKPSQTPTPTANPSQTPTPTPTSSNEVYVSNNGSASASGTYSNPKSLEGAISSAKAGQTIYMLPGTYSYSTQITIPVGTNGTSSARIKLIPYNNGSVTLNFSSQPYGSTDTNARGIQLDANYWHIYGIRVYGAADNGIFISGNNNIIEMCVLEANRDTGLQLSRRNSSLTSISGWPSNNLIKNCTSFNSYDPATGENADGFAAKLTSGEGNVFDGCIAYNNVDDGWDLYTKTDTGKIGSVTLRNCVAFRNGATSSGVFTANSDGNGFKLGGSSIAVAHNVENCIAFENKNHGFTDNSNPGPITLKNCTSFNNSLADGGKSNFDFARADTSNNYFTNIITFSTKSVSSDKYKGTATNCSFYNSSKYYLITSTSSVNTRSGSYGTLNTTGVKTSDFVSLSAPASSTNLHQTLRNSNGSVNLGNFLKLSSTSAYKTMGANLGN